MCSENTPGIFEIHIAGPKVEIAVARAVFDALGRVGLTKNKFFLGVYNVPTDGTYTHVGCTPPTGHDLENPGWMTTAKTTDFEEAKRYVHLGMEVLARHGLSGNFEVERVIGRGTVDYLIDVAKEFPDYQRVEDSPAFENHIIWKGTLGELPSYRTICEVVGKKFGVAPHQIVDFGRNLAGGGLVSRVATIYQPGREEALAFGEQLKGGERLEGHRYMVTEQVCLVGELKKT